MWVNWQLWCIHKATLCPHSGSLVISHLFYQLNNIITNKPCWKSRFSYLMTNFKQKYNNFMNSPVLRISVIHDNIWCRNMFSFCTKERWFLPYDWWETDKILLNENDVYLIYKIIFFETWKHIRFLYTFFFLVNPIHGWMSIQVFVRTIETFKASQYKVTAVG